MARASRARLVIRHKALECIGCCLCEETIPQYFEMNDQGMAVLKASQPDGVFFRALALRIDEEMIDVAVEGCPVDIIRADPS